MASDHQVALTRAHRMPAPSTHLSKAARQALPAFPQKLYEMVSDPNNQELICWSEAGDSFFVLNHERLAHEILGSWFKHRKFGSFVRQLNMYGFHKIPHLRQGVLKSDTDTEFWNFAHASFHRGQPDLLCLIQRKKQVLQPEEEGSIDLFDPNAGMGLLSAEIPGTGAPNTNAPPASVSLPPSQILDVNSILTSISTIKRHQTAISAELNELKHSNQHLLQDAMAARVEHQKQQDTINRIVKFLAGVFGHHAAAAGSGNVSGGSPGVSATAHGKEVVRDGTKGKMMLVIEDAKRVGPPKSMIQELIEIPMDADEAMYDSSYPTIETPLSAPLPSPSVAVSDNLTIACNNATPTVDSENPTPNSDSRSTRLTSNTINPIQHHERSRQQQGKALSRVVTPLRHSPTAFELDPRINGILNQFSPTQIQELLTSLASQTLSNPNTGVFAVNPNATTISGPLAHDLRPSSFGFSDNVVSQLTTFNPCPMPQVYQEGQIPFGLYSPTDERTLSTVGNSTLEQQQHDERLERQWQVAEDIDNDIKALDSTFCSLIQAYEPDPSFSSLLDDNLAAGGLGNVHLDDDIYGTAALPGDEGAGDGTSNTVDYDFDTFFNNLSNSTVMDVDGSNTNAMEYSDLASTAFLDEVPTPAASDLTASPTQPLRQVSPELNLGSAPNDVGGTGSHPGSSSGTVQNGNMNTGTPATGGRKRKSDVDFESLGAALADKQTPTAKTASTTPGKSKRRKDR